MTPAIFCLVKGLIFSGNQRLGFSMVVAPKLSNQGASFLERAIRFLNPRRASKPTAILPTPPLAPVITIGAFKSVNCSLIAKTARAAVKPAVPNCMACFKSKLSGKATSSSPLTIWI